MNPLAVQAGPGCRSLEFAIETMPEILLLQLFVNSGKTVFSEVIHQFERIPTSYQKVDHERMSKRLLYPLSGEDEEKCTKS
jgi:hypothetical protein